MITLATLLTTAAGCDEDKEKIPMVDAGTMTDAATVSPDAGAPDGGVTLSDGSMAPNITLVAWVHDLVESGTQESALPDTVDDKKVIDTEDEEAFASLLVPAITQTMPQ
jgi:hypothetical protein